MSLESNKDASDSEMFMKALAVSTIGLVAVGGASKGIKALSKSHEEKALIKDLVKSGGGAEKLSKEEIQKRTMEVKTRLSNGEKASDIRKEYFPADKDSVHDEITKAAADEGSSKTQSIYKVAEDKGGYNANSNTPILETRRQQNVRRLKQNVKGIINHDVGVVKDKIGSGKDGVNNVIDDIIENYADKAERINKGRKQGD